MSRVIAIIQCRLGSSRLPRKALMPIAGEPLIAHVVERVRRMSGLYAIAVATPASDRDEINTALRRYGSGDVPDHVHAFDDLDDADVLARFARVAGMYPMCDTVLRVTGDCPLWDPHQGERVLALFRDRAVDYASNIAPGYRDGEDVEVFTVDALRDAHVFATEPSDLEHVTPWIRRHCRTATLHPDEIRTDVKTSVDTLADLERVRAMVAA